MEDRRFDALARSLASGKNRRQVLKGLLGLGGAVAAHAVVPEAEAARRPTPTPKPPTCPGSQHWDGSACVCTSGETCGPDCCLIGSECCDNACCFGICYGEELCCPSPQDYCAVSGECCAQDWTCCPDYGCISPDQCCTAADCTPDTCEVAECTPSQTCEYIGDCRLAEGCCPTEACYRSTCQEDGGCSLPVFDCTNDDGTGCCDEGWTCCPGAGCLPPDQCCTTENCDPVACNSVQCLASHICEYAFDCNVNNQDGCCDEDEVCLGNGDCCLPVCDGDNACSDDGCGGLCPCPEGQSCINGACLTACPTINLVCGECGGCQCFPDRAGSTWCLDNVTPVGTCNSNADCPVGTICSNYDSGDPERRRLCAYPCCAAPS